MSDKILVSIPQEFPDKQIIRTPEQQIKIAKAIVLQDEIARKMQHVKTDSTEEIRRQRTTRKEV